MSGKKKYIYIIKRFKLNDRHWVETESDEDEMKWRCDEEEKEEKEEKKGGGYDSFVID